METGATDRASVTAAAAELAEWARQATVALAVVSAELAAARAAVSAAELAVAAAELSVSVVLLGLEPPLRPQEPLAERPAAEASRL